MQWLAKYGLGLLGIFLTGLYVYLQLLVWKKHGDDLMLPAASIIVTCSLWVTLAIAIVRSWRREAPAQTIAIDARPASATEVYELAFGYLPASPLNNGWKVAYKDNDAVPYFSSPIDPPGLRGLSLEVKKKYAMDYNLPPQAQSAEELELAIKYAPDAFTYIIVNVTSHDGSQKDHAWINVRLGSAPSRELKDYPKEFLVYVTPERLGNGWVRMRLRLPELVNVAMGGRGWVYDSMQKIRLRGCISVSPIKFFSP